MTPSKRIAPYWTAELSAAAAIAFGIALAIGPTWARGETQVRGTPQAVVVEAQNASVEEIMVALTDSFKVHFRSAANLDRRLTGTYEGTLQQAVSRILKGYDFAVKSGPAGLEITLLGAGTPVAVVEVRAATRPADAAAAPQPPTKAGRSGDRPATMPGSGGATPPVTAAQGPAPVPTRPAAAPSPVPQLGSGPVPSTTLPKPGDAPFPVPPLPTNSSAAPPTPTSSAPIPSSSATMPPVPSPTR
jgi:hypothetical protein